MEQAYDGGPDCPRCDGLGIDEAGQTCDCVPLFGGWRPRWWPWPRREPGE